MNYLNRPTLRWRNCVLLLAVSLITACGDSKQPTPEKATATETRTGGARLEVPAVNACSLLTSAEVEAAAGRKVMEPLEDHTTEQLSICGYGEPGSALLAGHPRNLVVQLSVLAGDNAYFEGPVAQVNASFDMITEHAGEVQQVKDLGERAHWAASLDTLRVVQGPYMLEVEVLERDSKGERIAGDPRNIAVQLARLMLERLP
jgi:hypothetical protein